MMYDQQILAKVNFIFPFRGNDPSLGWVEIWAAQSDANSRALFSSLHE